MIAAIDSTGKVIAVFNPNQSDPTQTIEAYKAWAVGANCTIVVCSDDTQVGQTLAG